MKIRSENSNTLADFDKIWQKGHKILKNQNFKICWIKSLDHLSIFLQNKIGTFRPVDF